MLYLKPIDCHCINFDFEKKKNENSLPAKMYLAKFSQISCPRNFFHTKHFKFFMR